MKTRNNHLYAPKLCLVTYTDGGENSEKIEKSGHNQCYGTDD